MTTEGDLPLLHIQPVAIDDQLENITSFLHKLKDTSPRSLNMVVQIIQSLERKEAVLGEDNKGRPVIQYKDKGKLSWDVSNTNKLAKPKSDDDVKLYMNVCLEHIEYQKINKPSSGVVLDSTCVQTNGGHYTEDKEFTKTETVLGTGAIAEAINEVKDNKTGKQMALKTIRLPFFRGEEVKSLIDLNETRISPAMYCFQLKREKIEIFMEIIDNAVTLRDVIDYGMGNISRQDPNLVRKFALYVFHRLLSVVHTIHGKGWTHGDLHAGNIMLQESSDGIKTRILDFGKAKPLECEDGLEDIAEVVRKFSALYIGQEFDDKKDMKDNWKDKIKMAKRLSTEAISEILYLVSKAIHFSSLSEVPQLLEEIAAKMKFDTRSMSVDVAKILFPKPDNVQSILPDSTGDGNTCTVKSDQNDGAQSLQDLYQELQE